MRKRKRRSAEFKFKVALEAARGTKTLSKLSSDITYISMLRGFMYRVAVIDWYSRYVLAWQLSNTLDGRFCLDALEGALAQGQRDIFSTDQGAQFTALAFTSRLEAADIRISMDGRGHAMDNVFVERLWRSVKYEHVYLHEYARVRELENGLYEYVSFYNHERLHQSLSQDPRGSTFAGPLRPGRELGASLILTASWS